MTVWDVGILLTVVAVSGYLLGYYKGKADAWTDAYNKGEKSGWNQAQRRLL